MFVRADKTVDYGDLMDVMNPAARRRLSEDRLSLASKARPVLQERRRFLPPRPQPVMMAMALLPRDGELLTDLLAVGPVRQVASRWCMRASPSPSSTGRRRKTRPAIRLPPS